MVSILLGSHVTKIGSYFTWMELATFTEQSNSNVWNQVLIKYVTISVFLNGQNLLLNIDTSEEAIFPIPEPTKPSEQYFILKI